MLESIGAVGYETCPLAAVHRHYFGELSAEPRIFIRFTAGSKLDGR